MGEKLEEGMLEKAGYKKGKKQKGIYQKAEKEIWGGKRKAYRGGGGRGGHKIKKGKKGKGIH